MRLTSEREAVVDENRAVAQGDAERKEGGPLEGNHGPQPIVAIDRLAPRAPKPDIDSVGQKISAASI
ncbi:hypothetical protein BLA3211_07138 [Burkholderia aenigmatica]|uniref:Uncharacterized protein n=1 Tax=Burkholderia aenigmatica TaxID=2015348 RepID=A0A6J5JKY4_9BURK|nr:hypothetical protein BLA3211_07138 [Burkholderia aenigmatica]